MPIPSQINNLPAEEDCNPGYAGLTSVSA